MEQALENVLTALEEIKNDQTIPKNVKTKLEEIITVLKEEKTEVSLRINKALHALDELTDETNLEAYTRTQIWNVVSLLEMINSQF